MTMSLFRQIRAGEIKDKDSSPRSADLLDYENLRQAKQRKHG